MFLAHFANTSIFDVLETDGNKIHYWYVEALKLHEKLNPNPDN